MKHRDPSSKFMAALRKSGASGYHKSKKINQIRKKKHKKRDLLFDKDVLV